MAKLYGAGGNIIALPLFLEVFAFFFEAIFLGIYAYTGDRFEDKRKHFLLLIPVVLGAAASGVFITVLNAFMNSPQGFDIVNGQLVNANPIAAMFTPSMPTKVSPCSCNVLYDSCIYAGSHCSLQIGKRFDPYLS